VLSRKEIHYPGVRSADILVALSQTALDAYIGDLKDEGILVIDPNSVKKVPGKKRFYEVPAMEIAHEVGSVKYQNAAALGALAAILGDRIKKASLVRAVSENVPESSLEKNLEAFEKGWAHVIAALSPAD
jgi:2-oxoglutarate ferredoxin oxidoreductase subunit gamma